MLEVRSELSEVGYQLSICSKHSAGLLKKRTVFEPIADWETGLAQLQPLAAAILDELEHTKKLNVVDSGRRLLSFAAAAELQNSDAALLDLLPALPYQLEIQSR